MIKAFRLDRNMTQKQVAVYLGVSVVTVNRLENGKHKAMDLTIARVKRQIEAATPQPAPAQSAA